MLTIWKHLSILTSSAILWIEAIFTPILSTGLQQSWNWSCFLFWCYNWHSSADWSGESRFNSHPVLFLSRLQDFKITQDRRLNSPNLQKIISLHLIGLEQNLQLNLKITEQFFGESYAKGNCIPKFKVHCKISLGLNSNKNKELSSI
jgi:hypothetical protein